MVPRFLKLSVVSVRIVAPSFMMHSFGMNQRMVVLKTSELYCVGSKEYRVTAIGPSTAEIAPPGYYLLFVVHAGIPSSAALRDFVPLFKVLHSQSELDGAFSLDLSFFLYCCFNSRALLLWKQTFGCMHAHQLNYTASFCASSQGMPEICMISTLDNVENSHR
ncbi:Aldehyde oxidase GLOX1 [Camellia lanceoleosa]|uniref:Aldehyde oxidase GLOX1 n=1 Tax=Camellia lanceoleosa TaxID=1840588 RepID=A0ACC0IIQ3_9ERIC|nr:Aldehyde oxidase GLOX1 [Camellia lanceoleosa]